MMSDLFSISGTGRVRAVIFDLDGTLVDSMWMWEAIDREYLSRFGFALPEDLQRELGGRSMWETALYFRTRFGIPDSEETMIADWNAMARAKYETEVPLKACAEEFLAWCRAQGLLLGIATSNSRELTETVLRARGLENAFDAVVTGDEAGRGKPAPDVYLKTAQKLRVAPGRCLVFEDVVDGILAGKAAGMVVSAVEDAFSTAQEADKRRLADYYIRDYSETGVLGGRAENQREAVR